MNFSKLGDLPPKYDKFVGGSDFQASNLEVPKFLTISTAVFTPGRSHGVIVSDMCSDLSRWFLLCLPGNVAYHPMANLLGNMLIHDDIFWVQYHGVPSFI